MRYIIFSRVSTGKQTTENQVLECLQYVKEKMKEGDDLIQFDEQNVSTRKTINQRPVLKQMLESLRRGDTLVVYKLNRLARAGNELVTIWHDLTKKGVNLVSLYEKQVDEMMIHAYAMVGQAERRNIREATRSGLKRKQANMEKVGTTWYGYKTDSTRIQRHQTDCHSHGKPYLLVPDEQEYRTLSLMVELHKEGRSYQEIASTLASKGYMNRKGNPFQKTSVYRILQRQERQYRAPKDLLAA